MISDSDRPQHSINLRGIKCPLNFVKTKLALEKLPIGGVLEVWIDSDSESAINVPNSLSQEGHEVLKTESQLSAGSDLLGSMLIWVRRGDLKS